LNKVMGDIITAVIDERVRQDSKWGEQNHNPSQWLSIMAEEFGEAAERVNEMQWGAPEMIKHNCEEYRKEMVQTIAVGIAALECLERNGPPPSRQITEASLISALHAATDLATLTTTLKSRYRARSWRKNPEFAFDCDELLRLISSVIGYIEGARDAD